MLVDERHLVQVDDAQMQQHVAHEKQFDAVHVTPACEQIPNKLVDLLGTCIVAVASTTTW